MDLIKSDIRYAQTLPSDCYRQEHFAELERATIWRKSWQLVAFREQVLKPGDVFPVEVMGEPIILVRDKVGTLRAVSNVCRHRAGKLVRTSGKAQFLRCQYHAWTYNLEGQLIQTPEFEGVCDFDKSKFQLPVWEVREWGPLVFVARDPFMPFETFLGEIPQVLETSAPGFFASLTHVERKDYLVEANWKVYVDNYLEGYHIGPVHPELARELDYSKYTTRLSRWYSEQIAPPRAQAELYGAGDSPGAHYFWMFPNLMLNIYQGLLQTNIVIPVDAKTCTVRFDWFRPRGAADLLEKKWRDLLAFSDLIQDQDAKICREVQNNLKSADYDRGRFSVQRENGVHHFHLLWQEITVLKA